MITLEYGVSFWLSRFTLHSSFGFSPLSEPASFSGGLFHFGEMEFMPRIKARWRPSLPGPLVFLSMRRMVGLHGVVRMAMLCWHFSSTADLRGSQHLSFTVHWLLWHSLALALSCSWLWVHIVREGATLFLGW